MFNISKNLKEWAYTRRISSQASERNGFCANIIEELLEGTKAYETNDEHEKIDYISDIVVFSVVEMLKLNFETEDILNSIHPAVRGHAIKDNSFNYKEYNYHITTALGKWLEAWDKNNRNKKEEILNSIVLYSLIGLKESGYDPYKVLQETHKEINSRTGAWNSDIQKWQKFKTPEAKALWYKSDFVNCKL